MGPAYDLVIDVTANDIQRSKSIQRWESVVGCLHCSRQNRIMFERIDY